MKESVKEKTDEGADRSNIGKNKGLDLAKGDGIQKKIWKDWYSKGAGTDHLLELKIKMYEYVLVR